MSDLRQRLGAAVMARLDDLATCSTEPKTLTRYYLTPAHQAAALRVSGWMAEAGLAVEIDAAGTVVGRASGTNPAARTLILGSHIDTIRDAGRFDGTLGVAVAIAALGELARTGERLPVAIEVVAFGDEEGVRFPVTLTGSRALAGRFDPATLAARDENGVSLREALTTFGCDPDRIDALQREPGTVAGYVEVHIEQGPVLEAETLPVGVVTAIAGASRLTVAVTGEAGHAGTTPMALRRDALAAAAEMALATERLAGDTAHLVATVGRMDVSPGAVNVVPGAAAFTLDVRSPDDDIRRAAIETLGTRFAAIAARRGVTVRMEITYDERAAPCGPALTAALAEAVAAAGLRVRLLPSGAGHDGLAMASLCPIGMLFVRCAGGISHNPAESVALDDAGWAVEVLLRFLRGFGG